MVTSLKHPGKNQSGSSSRLPLTWTNRATPRADAQCYKHRPMDRQMYRMTAIQRLKSQRQTDTHTLCSDLQGPDRPGDHCFVLALEEHTRGRILGPHQPLPRVSANHVTPPPQPATPTRHPAIPPPDCSVRAQGRPRQARETPGARMPPRQTRRPARPRSERGRRPHPGSRPSRTDTHRAPRIPPPPPAPALPSLGGLQVAAARAAGRTAEHAQSRPEGRGPGRP